MRATTTALFAETLITGFGVIAWLGLCVAWLFGVPQLVDLQGLEIAGLATAIVASSYVLGALWERLADMVLLAVRFWLDGTSLKNWLTAPLVALAEYDMSDNRVVILHAEQRMTEFSDYMRRHIRIVRSASLYLPLVTAFLTLYLESQPPADTRVWVFAMVVGVVLTLTSWFVLAAWSATYSEVLR